jgi:hypothetical protein
MFNTLHMDSLADPCRALLMSLHAGMQEVTFLAADAVAPASTADCLVFPLLGRG